MKVLIIGGANADIFASSSGPFIAGDSNPGTVSTSPGGVGRNIAHNLALLGDKVSFLTVFGSDSFGHMLRDSCKEAGIDISRSEVVRGARNACFVSVHGADGELLGGVSDMAITWLMTPEWLEARIPAINAADAVVADTNLPAATLALLVGCCQKPLYIDAVSSAKVVRLREALAASRLPDCGRIYVKCNRIEGEVLQNSVVGSSGMGVIDRLFVSLGSEGVQIRENGTVISVPAKPVTGIVNTTGAGDALLAGIVHCGPDANPVDAVHFGQSCARMSMLTASAVNPAIANLAYLDTGDSI